MIKLNAKTIHIKERVYMYQYIHEVKKRANNLAVFCFVSYTSLTQVSFLDCVC